MIIILLGPPGAGKGTQAINISKKFNIPHISTGDILRKEIKEGSGLGKKAKEYVEGGKLVPDEIIVGIIEKKLDKDSTNGGALLDGFPRTIEQAEMLDRVLAKRGLSVDKVLNLEVDRKELIKRLSSRRLCKSCKQITKVEESGKNRCPECGGTLIKRKDDDIKVIKKRLEVYRKQTEPLIDYYQSRGVLVNVDGDVSEAEVTERILNAL
ncbi:MAG: adenylate kinase [Candidatus Humimicrobiaceae bacterium]